MRRYVSWKGPEGIREAEEYERELRKKLGREPTKRDFQEAGLYNVWMALYRKRRITSPGEKKCEKTYYSIEEGLLKSKKLMNRMIAGIVSSLGPDEVEAMVARLRKKQ
jgi:hypothetical protein